MGDLPEPLEDWTCIKERYRNSDRRLLAIATFAWCQDED